MSETEYPTEAVAIADKPTRKRGRPAKYNWDLLLDGEQHQIAAGDLIVSPENFRSLVHTTAKRRGIKAKTKIVDDQFFVKAENGTVPD